jgi:alpha-2-macroglobulin
MKKKQLIIVFPALLLVLIGLIVAYIHVNSNRQKPSTADFSSYVTAHTSGVMSTSQTIMIVFSSAMIEKDEVGQAADSRLFRIRPSVRGSLRWYDEKTLEFLPAEPLSNDSQYSVSLMLDRLLDDLPEKYRVFTFQIKTIKQAMDVTLHGLAFYEDSMSEYRRFSGSVITADGADLEKIMKTIRAHQDGKELEISWESNVTMHQFWIEGIKQSEDNEIIVISADGRPINADYADTFEREIPSKGVFRLLAHDVVQSPEQYLEIRFSERIDPSQHIRGLIHSAGLEDLRIIVDQNLVRVYPPERLTGEFYFEISEGIRNTDRELLGENFTFSALFELIKPLVRFVGGGTILPSPDGLLLPFQAVNLRAVDVRVEQIFENNITQFFQVNAPEGSSDLRRVGRMVLRKTILLDQAGNVNYNIWNTYHLDLRALIETEPGAIYRVSLDFRKEYSTYSCDGETEFLPIEIIEEIYDPHDDIPEQYYFHDDYPYDYFKWSERDNPCDVSYYRYKSISQNALASNLGIIAKSGTDGSYMLAVTNLNTTEAVGGVSIEIINYQQQLLTTGTTDHNGLATFSFQEQEKPFLAIARYGRESGYLKLDRGSSLSLSAFDVSGAHVSKGLKGFMYGERGVWRPGDTLFISFVLEDKGHTLPKNHPLTFEISDPRGRLVHSATTTRANGDIYAFPVDTEKEAITGNYTARVRAGGVTFTETFKVETIMPNRLKIMLDIEGEALYSGRQAKARLTSAWLHGAPARNLNARVDATFTQSSTSFNQYQDYTFDDPVRTFYAEEQTIFEGQLNETGVLSFSPDIHISSAAPGKLNANFSIRVFEEGGAFSIDRFTMPYYPYEHFVGIKMPDSQNKRNIFETDTTYTVEIVTVQADGRPAANRTLNLEVYKIDWRWWWERGSESLSNYVSSHHHSPIAMAAITTNNTGRGQYDLKVNHPEWGRFLIRITDPAGGHATGDIAYFDWPGWVSRDRRATPETTTMLAFASDKESYEVGETVHVTIPGPEKGKIFLTIENGVRVIENHWLDAEAGETRFSFTASEGMTPNVYINAMLLQPHAQTANDLPIRMYGIVPIRISDPRTHLFPVIEMQDVLAPEEAVSISISEKNGKPMAFTLAMVDDGLLDLTRFRTPDPWNHFYAREALGVTTWDLYDQVLGSSAGQMQRIISIGGDEALSEQGDQTANRFKPVVRYFGPYMLEKGKTELIEFTMPNYVGSVRVMAVAVRDGAYGSAEKTIPVRKPLMVLGTLSRVLGPQETVMLPVTVFAMDEAIKNVHLKVETNHLLTIDGSSEQSISFIDIGEQVVRFRLKAAEQPGVATVRIIATSGNERATYDIELDVRNPNPPMTIVRDTILQAGQSWETTYEAFGMQGTNKASIELSTLPPVNLDKRLKYLLDYPHGCLEQLVSQAFPQLFLSRFADVNDAVREMAEENVRHAMSRIRNYRTHDGGLSLWPGGHQTDHWASIYAGHFLLEAQKLGYSVPEGVMSGWTRSTGAASRNWSARQQQARRNSDLIQAYRLYAMALAGEPELGAMNRLRESADLSVAARWRLAAAYILTSNPQAANTLTSGIPTSAATYREQSFTYGSDIRDKAMIVETLVMMNKPETAMNLLSELSERLSSDTWMSTQEISFSLLAFYKFSSENKTSEEIKADISIHRAQAQRKTSKMNILSFEYDPVQSGNEIINIHNMNEGMLFARVVNHGIPAAGDEVTQNRNLQMAVDYYLMDGTPISVANMGQGTDFYADVKVYNPGVRGKLEQMILSFVVPSGWEILSGRSDDDNTAYQQSAYDFQDVRDDRVYTYFNLDQGQTKTFRFRFNAAYEGRFYLPGVHCEAMYDNTITARKKGEWVEVRLP